MNAFAAAVESLKSLMAAQGISTELAWVSRQDVVWDGSQLLVRVPLPIARNETIAALVERRLANRLGVALMAFAQAERLVLGYVVLPRDGDEAERLMIPINSVKISVAERPLPAVEVRSATMWAVRSTWAKLTERSSRLGYPLPSPEELRDGVGDKIR